MTICRDHPDFVARVRAAHQTYGPGPLVSVRNDRGGALLPAVWPPDVARWFLASATGSALVNYDWPRRGVAVEDRGLSERETCGLDPRAFLALT